MYLLQLSGISPAANVILMGVFLHCQRSEGGGGGGGGGRVAIGLNSFDSFPSILHFI